MQNSLDILLVEDNADLASNIIEYLEALGHRVHYSPDGEAGLEQLRLIQPEMAAQPHGHHPALPQHQPQRKFILP